MVRRSRNEDCGERGRVRIEKEGEGGGEREERGGVRQRKRGIDRNGKEGRRGRVWWRRKKEVRWWGRAEGG